MILRFFFFAFTNRIFTVRVIITQVFLLSLLRHELPFFRPLFLSHAFLIRNDVQIGVKDLPVEPESPLVAGHRRLIDGHLAIAAILSIDESTAMDPDFGIVEGGDLLQGLLMDQVVRISGAKQRIKRFFLFIYIVLIF